MQALTATLEGGNLPPAVMAKAFYVRGLAYRQQRKPAQAISDLTSALWLRGGLGGEERADALKQRAAAYADAGLTPRGRSPAPEPAKSPPATSAGGNWISSLFGFPPSSPPPPRVTGTTSQADRPVAAKASNVSGGWTSNTEVETARAPAKTARAPARPPKRETRPARARGKYQVQVAAVRTNAQAVALAAKVKREHAAVLAASEPDIDKAVLGNMGSFYRVRFGPFASLEQTRAVCAKLKSGGLDCMTITP